MSQQTLNSAWRSRKGRHFEARALQWLQARGLRLVQRNYRCKLGEIDLIMRERELLVFVEVRFRSRSSLAAACATVDRRKQQKLLRCAQHFLLWNREYAELPSRFDVIGISSGEDQPHFEWVRNAFT